MKQLLCKGPRTGRGWQASPDFRIAVRGCDLTSLACSKVGFLGHPGCSVDERQQLELLRAWLGPPWAAEWGLVRPLERRTPVSLFQVKVPIPGELGKVDVLLVQFYE